MKTVNKEEVEKFSKIAEEWWDPNGKFKPLHKFNPVRLEFIISEIIKHFSLDRSKKKPLSGIKILDIGCGGGLVSEPLSMLGAEVTAIDASEKNINIAKAHQSQSKANVNYQNKLIEDMSKDNKFDVIVALEIIEHVENPEFFINQSLNHLKSKSLFFVATINRTINSLIFAKFTAEYILNWLPKGTHDWKKFLKPSEIRAFIKESEYNLKKLTGFSYSPFSDNWQVSQNISQNYIMLFNKLK